MVWINSPLYDKAGMEPETCWGQVDEQFNNIKILEYNKMYSNNYPSYWLWYFLSAITYKNDSGETSICPSNCHNFVISLGNTIPSDNINRK